MIMNGTVVEFITDIDEIEADTHHIVYEWTETLVGEKVVEIHDTIR